MVAIGKGGNVACARLLGIPLIAEQAGTVGRAQLRTPTTDGTIEQHESAVRTGTLVRVLSRML